MPTCATYQTSSCTKPFPQIGCPPISTELLSRYMVLYTMVVRFSRLYHMFLPCYRILTIFSSTRTHVSTLPGTIYDHAIAERGKYSSLTPSIITFNLTTFVSPGKVNLSVSSQSVSRLCFSPVSSIRLPCTIVNSYVSFDVIYSISLEKRKILTTVYQTSSFSCLIVSFLAFL